MIISASRRTDIPAFYAEWMVRRLKEGYCTVANPFNRNQVTWISLKPEDVDAIVFWTRNPRPLMPYLDELDSRGYRYYFQFTILGYPREIDAKSPTADTAVETFRELAERLGPKRVIWRYDPIVFTGMTPPAFHQENFQRLAESLRGHTRRVVVSIVDMYRKIEKRLKKLEGTQAAVSPCDAEDFGVLMCGLAGLAGENGMEIVSCAEEIDLRPFGIFPGKCVDDRVISEASASRFRRRRTRPNARRAVVSSAGTSGCTSRACSDAGTATPPRTSTRRKPTSTPTIRNPRRCSAGTRRWVNWRANVASIERAAASKLPALPACSTDASIAVK